MDGIEIVKLEKMLESHKNTHAQGGKEGNDSDDEEEDPRQGHGGV